MPHSCIPSQRNDTQSRWRRFAVTALCLCAAPLAAVTSNEHNGIVMFDAEDALPAAGWALDTAGGGYLGTGYVRATTNADLQGPLRYTVTITNGGRYQLNWRNKVGHGTDTTESNDSFIRMVDSRGRIVPVVPNDNVETGGWWKTFVSDLDWTWDAHNHDHVNRSLSWNLSAGNSYTLEVGTRSRNHVIDHISLWAHELHNLARKDRGGANDSQDANFDVLTTTWDDGSDGGGTADPYILVANDDFSGLSSGDIPYYRDTRYNALAIDASVEAHRTGFAQARHTFSGTSGTYDVAITTMTEEDGESEYRLAINGTVVATYTNPYIGPGSSSNLQPQVHIWNDITINNGDVISIRSKADTNGEIPEAGGTAWARGRWRQLALTPPDTTDSGSFNMDTDILIAQFDGRSDADDIHSQAALGCMMVHPDFAGLNVYGVMNAYGEQTTPLIWDSSTLMNMVFGTGLNNWTNAHADWSGSADRIAAKAKAILDAGGRVWVMEAGQSDITADWVAILITQGVNQQLIKNNVVVVQHSSWNENQTNDADLAYIKEKTDYRKIPDGNHPNNGSADYETNNNRLAEHIILFDEAKSASNPNAVARALWTEADQLIGNWGENYSIIDEGGLDFSDCVEAWYIFELGDSLDQIPEFWTKYVVNTDSVTDNAPTAALSVPASATVGQAVIIDASGSTDDIGIVTYRYRIWDSTSTRLINEFSSESSTTFTFTAADTYNIQVRVEDISGQRSTATASITVSNDSSSTPSRRISISVKEGHIVDINPVGTMSDQTAGGITTFQFSDLDPANDHTMDILNAVNN